MVNASDSESRSRRFEPHSGQTELRIKRSEVRASLGSNRVVSLSKAHLLSKSTGNTQEAMAPSQHD